MTRVTRKSNCILPTHWCEAVPEDSESLTNYLTCNSHLRESVNSSSEESEIEIIGKQSPSSGAHEASYHDTEGSVIMDSWLRVGSSTSDEGCHAIPDNEALESWESEGGACAALKQNAVNLSEDFVLLDGYETDVESIVSCEGAD